MSVCVCVGQKSNYCRQAAGRGAPFAATTFAAAMHVKYTPSRYAKGICYIVYSRDIEGVEGLLEPNRLALKHDSSLAISLIGLGLRLGLGLCLGLCLVSSSLSIFAYFSMPLLFFLSLPFD